MRGPVPPVRSAPSAASSRRPGVAQLPADCQEQPAAGAQEHERGRWVPADCQEQPAAGAQEHARGRWVPADCQEQPAADAQEHARGRWVPADCQEQPAAGAQEHARGGEGDFFSVAQILMRHNAAIFTNFNKVCDRAFQIVFFLLFGSLIFLFVEWPQKKKCSIVLFEEGEAFCQFSS